MSGIQLAEAEMRSLISRLSGLVRVLPPGRNRRSIEEQIAHGKRKLRQLRALRMERAA